MYFPPIGLNDLNTCLNHETGGERSNLLTPYFTLEVGSNSQEVPPLQVSVFGSRTSMNYVLPVNIFSFVCVSYLVVEVPPVLQLETKLTSKNFYFLDKDLKTSRENVPRNTEKVRKVGRRRHYLLDYFLETLKSD